MVEHWVNRIRGFTHTQPRVYQSPGGPGTSLAGLNKLFYWCRNFRPTGVNPLLWRFFALDPVPPECTYCARCIQWRTANPTQCVLPLVSSRKPFHGCCKTPLSKWIGVKACLARAAELARMFQTGSNVGQLISDAHFARNICVCWNRIIIFSVMVCQSWPQMTSVWPAVKLQRLIRNIWNIAQFVGHCWLLNLFFGSLETDDWLLRYGHFKVLGWWGSKN